MPHDIDLTCQDCSQTFLFSADEQQFFAEKGFTEPKRCRPCRQARKERGGHGGSGDRPARPQRDNRRDDREMFDATCAECQAKTQVPFQPSGDRPVYCRDCFRLKSSTRPSRGR